MTRPPHLVQQPRRRVGEIVLDELVLDTRATLFLSFVDGATPLSWILGACGLDSGSAMRTLCELVERRILVLRPPR